MKRKIVLISDNQSFILRSLSDNLAKSGYECVICPADVTEVKHQSQDTGFFFVNLDETIVEKTEFFIFLRDLCNEDEKKVIFVGYKEHLETVSTVIPSALIAGFFERPINVGQIVASMDKIFEKEATADHQKHILVVDDSGEMLRTVKTWLSGTYKVSMANSAVNAITFLSSNTPDLILLDYEMPVCSGPQMLEMIRAEVKTADIPVMFLTGKSDSESVKAVLSLKPQGYILKSRTKEEILEVISTFFAAQKA